MTTDYDLERITTIAKGGLDAVREVEPTEDCDPDTLALDTFSIVAVFTYKTADGGEREAAAVFSESRRCYVQQGVLARGLERLKEMEGGG